MFNIRQSSFETNSSSTHTLTFCTEQQMLDWKSGKTFLNPWSKTQWIPATPELLAEDADTRMDNDILTYEEYREDGYLHYYERSYETPNGEKIYAFGKYGYDG